MVVHFVSEYVDGGAWLYQEIKTNCQQQQKGVCVPRNERLTVAPSAFVYFEPPPENTGLGTLVCLDYCQINKKSRIDSYLPSNYH